jgi:hypothetical protein
MNISWNRAHLLLLPLFALACGSSESSDPADAAAPDAAQIADAAPVDDGGEGDALPAISDGGLAQDAGAADTLAPVQPAGLAVVHGDSKYTSSLLSLLDPSTGALVHDNCLNSGSATPGLSQALSGDVVLPSTPLPGHPLVLIDRINNNLIWVNPAECKVTKQISVKDNPHDALAVSANKLYVTRYNTDPKPATALDGGGDLLVLDMAQGQPVARIDLAPFVGGSGFTPNPDRGLVLGGKLYITLNGFNADFSKAAPGRVVVVDPSTDTVVGTINLPGLQNCGPIAPVPGMPKALAVACAGAYSDPDRLNVSGIALVDTATTPATVTTVLASVFGRPLSTSDMAMVGPGLGLVVVPGDFSGTPADTLWRFDFVGGPPQRVLSAKGSFVLGGLVYNPTSQRAFIGESDAKAPSVHVMDVSSAVPVELAPIDSDPSKGMLPRSIGLY